ncbi:hypothetical protein PILCRDRAFT_819322 [Piloderma croceum F 1598]|uniref:Uncharacterized protein n=1 Tax=Piloderma croceum (strain F 1598) TaxID=765440 RepID=A0A0C3FVY4_PILCF|nr:hypothetical protein PILCRDRAFT_819322 [Piloderma croceum F 1598]
MPSFTTVITATLLLATPLLMSVRAESHQVTFTNNCGRGTPLFLYQGNGNPQGATTIQGELNGGIAWLGNQGNCESSGVNCGAVEFTLQNTGYSQADFTLETGSGLGNHQYTYAMAFNFINGCSNGASCDEPNCPCAFTDPTNGCLYQCSANNAGIHIQFC